MWGQYIFAAWCVCVWVRERLVMILLCVGSSALDGRSQLKAASGPVRLKTFWFYVMGCEATTLLHFMLRAIHFTVCLSARLHTSAYTNCCCWCCCCFGENHLLIHWRIYRWTICFLKCWHCWEIFFFFFWFIANPLEADVVTALLAESKHLNH